MTNKQLKKYYNWFTELESDTGVEWGDYAPVHVFVFVYKRVPFMMRYEQVWEISGPLGEDRDLFTVATEEEFIKLFKTKWPNAKFLGDDIEDDTLELDSREVRFQNMSEAQIEVALEFIEANGFSSKVEVTRDSEGNRITVYGQKNGYDNFTDLDLFKQADTYHVGVAITKDEEVYYQYPSIAKATERFIEVLAKLDNGEKL